MPQPFNSSDELSLRHLPDVSESSFSFQIPGTIRDNLLVDDDLDFFKGTDVSIAPLASPLTTIEPLFTVTPKPESPEKLPSEAGSKLDSFPTLPYDHYEDLDTNPKHKKANPRQGSRVTSNVSVFSKPKPKAITTPSAVLPSPQKSPAVRLDNLRVELNMLSDKLLVGPSTSVNHQDMPSDIRIRPKGILKKSLEKKHLQRISPRNNQVCRYPGVVNHLSVPVPDIFSSLHSPAYLTDVTVLCPIESDFRWNLENTLRYQVDIDNILRPWPCY